MLSTGNPTEFDFPYSSFPIELGETLLSQRAFRPPREFVSIFFFRADDRTVLQGCTSSGHGRPTFPPADLPAEPALIIDPICFYGGPSEGVNPTAFLFR